MPQSSDGQVLQVSTVVDPNLATHFVSGLWGGIGPTGDLIVYLYHDAIAIPSGFRLHVNAANQLTAEVPEEDPRAYTRTVEVKLVIPPLAARGLATWLLENADAAEGIMRQVLSAAPMAQASP